jgi:hypothetical protein
MSMELQIGGVLLAEHDALNRIKEFAFLPDCCSDNARSDNAPKFCPVAVWMSCKLGRNAEATDSLANPNQHKYRLT